MLISKKTIKIISFFSLIILLLSILLPFKKVFASDPTLSFDSKVISTQDATTGKWQWGFTIRTTDIPNGSILRSRVYKDGKSVQYKQSTINNNTGYFITGYILEPDTTYKVLFALPDFSELTKEYQGTAGGTPPQPNPSSANTKTVYTPLAPLPGIGTPGCVDANGKACIDTLYNKDTNPCPFGQYLNLLIKLFFGICGVLAVVMVLMGGIQYMTSDLVSSKEEGKNTIIHAILGLLLALGAWLILNTLNPNLLNVCLNTLPPAEITIQDDTETPDTAQAQKDYTPPTGGTVGCPEGITKVITTKGGNFYLCKTIAEKVKQMVNTAWLESPVKGLSGGSYRSKQEQEALRAKNCGGNSQIYNKGASCSPSTAYPGTSRHENGLAVDFKCGGALIRATDNVCFLWLKNKAGTYGLKNLKTGTEPWHWSTDGK